MRLAKKVRRLSSAADEFEDAGPGSDHRLVGKEGLFETKGVLPRDALHLTQVCYAFVVVVVVVDGSDVFKEDPPFERSRR